MLDAAVGGQGGRGGHGGGGGGGGGGISFDLFVSGSNAFDPGYANDNAFELAPNVNTAGPGGFGGTSSNTQIGQGEDGLPGLAGTVHLE